ncbi:MAG: MBL fold metallo-hydrolase [Actinobacteria bacterium]|jgi:ribonuclease BN (tRNA processing enzyme)|nr:MBL fold metallo-hydrolase [Actinomycetota bacterium]MCL6096004.1 MBL fold metallo-hydrolase [Actinomycetota bacterium]
MLSLRVLGRDGGYPGPGGSCSGYLLSDGPTTIWVEAGPGSLANLQLYSDPGAVDAIVISHEHPDHCSDLDGYAVLARYGLGRSNVAVYAPFGVRERCYHRENGALSWTEVDDGDRIEVFDMVVSFSRTDHKPKTLAIRIDAGGRSLGYSADTGPAWSLEALGEGLDMALCEATFTARYERDGIGHMSARQAGEMARSAGIGRLVLTHIWPTLSVEDIQAQANEAYGSQVEIAEQGAIFWV